MTRGRPIASSCPHQTSPYQTHHLRAPLPRRQAPRSRSAHLGHARQYYKCFTLPIVEPLSVLLTEFHSARLPNDVLRELTGNSFSATRHPQRALPGLLLRAAPRGGWVAGVEPGGDGRGLLGISTGDTVIPSDHTNHDMQDTPASSSTASASQTEKRLANLHARSTIPRASAPAPSCASSFPPTKPAPPCYRPAATRLPFSPAQHCGAHGQGSNRSCGDMRGRAQGAGVRASI